MSRSVRVYQCWDGSDMAESDAWFQTLTEARTHMSDAYGVALSAVVLDDDGGWEGEANDGVDVHVRRFVIVLTGEGVCHALTFLPNR